jgi:hypothetical protein
LTRKHKNWVYDDARSDDKSVEPESVVVTKMGDKTILFVGLEKLRLWCMMFQILLFYRLLKRVMRLRAFFQPKSPTKEEL